MLHNRCLLTIRTVKYGIDQDGVFHLNHSVYHKQNLIIIHSPVVE